MSTALALLPASPPLFCQILKKSPTVGVFGELNERSPVASVEVMLALAPLVSTPTLIGMVT